MMSAPAAAPRSSCGLLGITYSEFDNKVGPRLKFQFPPDAIRPEDFEAFSEYVIVGKHLCGKIIAVRNDHVQFVNYSVAIDNPKYDRNTLLFAIGFVLEKETDTKPIEPALEKIATCLVTLERESEYLFKEETKAQLTHLLETVFIGLCTKREVTYFINESNMLNVKLYNVAKTTPIALRDFDVPIMKYQDVRSLSLLRWDISITRVLHWIDGTSCVRKIAEDADMDVDCVKRCLQLLHLYGCIIVTGIFRFSNVYMLICSDINGLMNGPLLAEIQRFSELPGMATVNLSSQSTQPDVPLVQFICSCRPGVTIGELLLKHKHILRRYDIKKLIAACEHHKIIRRIHQYPILPMVGRESDGADDVSSYILTGASTMESICFKREISAQEILSLNPYIINK